MKRKNKKLRLKRGLSLKNNKKFFGIFIVAFSLIIIINATLAWSSYSEWVKNHIQSNPEEVAVQITEKFEQESVLAFETKTEKSVKVKNLSNRKAIIRVHFKESLLPFAIDMSDGEGNGNGSIKTVQRSGEALIDLDDVKTWNAGNLLDSGLSDGNASLYYQAVEPVVKEEIYTGEDNRGDASRPAGLNFFRWQFNTAVHALPQVAVTSPYWVFDGECFYYSQVLEGGETTAIDLLQVVVLSDVNIPNQYKFALYNIEIEAEGIEATKAGLESWTTDAAYLSMYKEDTRFD